MDMEKMKKINELAAELKKHKTILDDDDTVKKAQEIVGEDENPIGLPEDKNPGEKGPSEAELLIKESNKAIKEHLDLMRRALLQLHEDFKAFKKETEEKLEKVKQLALSAPLEAKPAPTKDEMPAQEPAKEATAPAEPAKTEDKKPEPKKEGFNPGDDDVSVDKVFYFGKK